MTEHADTVLKALREAPQPPPEKDATVMFNFSIDAASVLLSSIIDCACSGRVANKTVEHVNNVFNFMTL